MNVLVTGANGFVGKNLVQNLKNIRDGKNKTHPDITIERIFEYDIESSEEELDFFCSSADFIFDFAGVNRPDSTEEFWSGNRDFTERLTSLLLRHRNRCPIVYSSSVQASLSGRYAFSDYGKSKLAGEKILFDYMSQTGSKCYIFRFPNLFGKWCRPNYNSVTATFCHNIAHGLPITVNDGNTVLTLLYIDDLVDSMLDCIEGKTIRCNYIENDIQICEDGLYCCCTPTYNVLLDDMVKLLYSFRDQSETLIIPEIAPGSFEKKLYSTYLSYLPGDSAAFSLKMNKDSRGSFTELIKTLNCGQFSVNISEPGVTKGQHWHNSKWELFIVVSGHGLIRERKIGSEQTFEYEVSGDDIKAIHMLPGYTHSIVNLSETEKLITVMWANEIFDPDKPDTFFETV